MECLKLDADVGGGDEIDARVLDQRREVLSELFGRGDLKVDGFGCGSECVWKAVPVPQPISRRVSSWPPVERHTIMNRILAPALGKRETRENGRLGN